MYKPLRSAICSIISYMLVVTLCCQPSTYAAYTYQLAIAAIFQNEAPYLKEWLEFHKLVGVEHFYLYNNNSTDNYLEILQPYINNNQVTLIDWPYAWKTGQYKDWFRVQCGAYKNALDRTRYRVKWVAFLDLDEFLFATHEDNLIQFLTKYENYGGLCVNWQFFGTSFLQTIPSDKLMIEVLTRKAVTNYVGNKQIKSIVQPAHVMDCSLSPHYFVYKPGYFQVNSKYQQFTGREAPTVCVDDIRINHYWTRHEAYFRAHKLPSRQRFGNDYRFLINRYKLLNTVEDKAILRFVPALRKQMKLN